MKLQSPDKKTLREASGSFIQESSLVASDSEFQAMAGFKCDGQFPEGEDGGLGQGGDKVKKIEVSGGNISLVVDFSGSICSDHVFESCANENGYREDHQGQEFLVGNLVWAMTKHKKWWPGEVVNFKADAKKSFMVRYLDQNQLVSWCSPSKLKPFKESFEQAVNQRNDIEFFVAVEKAMALLSNSLKLEMTCSCIAKGNGVMSSSTHKTKPLILREFSVDRLEPKEFVTQLKNLARCVSNTAGVLETTVMKSRLSAFYSFSGYKQIPMGQLHQSKDRKGFATAKMKDNEFIGSPSIVAGSSRKRFMKNWFRKFVSEVDNVSARDDLVNTSPSDLISKLKLLAVDYKCSEEMENTSLFEWFFSKFRISMFHDENAYKLQLANMAGLKDLKLAKTSKSKKLLKSKMERVSDEQKTSESKDSKMEPLNCVPTPDNEQKASERHIVGHSDFNANEKGLQEKPDGKASVADALSRPAAATIVPDLNTGVNPLSCAEFEHLQRPETLSPHNVCPQEEKIPRSMVLNFQVTAPCSTNRISETTQLVSSQPSLGINFTNADLTSLGKKKRGRKRKNANEVPTGIPDLNGISAEPTPVPPRRRRRKKEEQSNGVTRGITILFLKFSSQVAMPSRDDLTSTFSAFGPLDAWETHVSEEYSGAQVAFVSSGDAIEAVKSLEKANPFGETLVNFRLQQKLITVQRNIAPRMPVIAHVSPVPKPNNTPTSVDSMRQNLMMMTAMLEKSGDSLSRETKAKLKSEITGLLEKVSSMPSSSSS